MKNTELYALRYPIGEFNPKENYSSGELNGYISSIETFPEKIKEAVTGMNDSQLDTPYRPDGWSVRRVVHHVVDSHVNCYCRFKLALTEDNPTIRPYNEADWAELPEAKTGPVDPSLEFLDILHKKLIITIKNIKTEQYKRTLFHPESKLKMTIENLLHLYGWHCQHHLAHIINLKKEKNW
ncbi:MAG: putative metal-dependent hydrolase YfiT [Chlorobi bacterium OLB5]|nr:MAG: putative metal-dependent hydrolase YfiT [Chlorobi bacterium OLB5]